MVTLGWDTIQGLDMDAVGPTWLSGLTWRSALAVWTYVKVRLGCLGLGEGPPWLSGLR